jgi:hypothetical protein
MEALNKKATEGKKPGIDTRHTYRLHQGCSLCDERRGIDLGFADVPSASFMRIDRYELEEFDCQITQTFDKKEV